jgi:hypothetical protein
MWSASRASEPRKYQEVVKGIASRLDVSGNSGVIVISMPTPEPKRSHLKMLVFKKGY